MAGSERAQSDAAAGLAGAKAEYVALAGRSRKGHGGGNGCLTCAKRFVVLGMADVSSEDGSRTA